MISDGSTSTRNASSTIESISIYTIALRINLIVNRVSWALSALTLNADKSTITNTYIFVQVQNLVHSAFRSADGKLSIIVVRLHAVCADSVDEVEIFQTDADSVD